MKLGIGELSTIGYALSCRVQILQGYIENCHLPEEQKNMYVKMTLNDIERNIKVLEKIDIEVQRLHKE